MYNQQDISKDDALGSGRKKSEETTGGSKSKMVLKDDKPQPNLNLNHLDPDKKPDTAESMLEFAILTISNRFKLTPKYAAGLLANSFKLLAQIVIKGLKKDYFPVLEWYSDFLKFLNTVVNLSCYDSHAFKFTLNILRPGFYSASPDVVTVTCKVYKALLSNLSKQGLDENVWNYLVMNNGGIGAILNCYRRSPMVINELVGVIYEFGKSNMN